MSSLKNIEKYGKLLLFGAVDVAIGILAFFPLMAGYSYALIKIAASGLVMMLSRAIFLAIIPFILKHTDIFLDIVNITIVFSDIFIDLVIFIIDAATHYIHDLISVVNDASRILGAGKLPFNIPALNIHFIKISTISRHAFKRFLIDIETTCPAYNSAEKIFYFITRDLFNSFSCPLVRYTYPVRWIFDALQELLGWSYHGTAAPLVDHPGANCDGGTYGSPDYICVGLGIGFFITEVLIPMLVLFVVLILIIKGLFMLLRVAIFGFFKLLDFLEIIAVLVINKVEHISTDILLAPISAISKLFQDA